MINATRTLGFLFAAALLIGVVSCGSDEPTPLTEAPASLAAELFGTPTIAAGTTVETIVQGIAEDDVLTLTQSPEGVETTIKGQHPDRRVIVKVPAGAEPGLYPIEFLLVGSDSSQVVRWEIRIS